MNDALTRTILALVAGATVLSGCSDDDDGPMITQYLQTERMAIPALNTVMIAGDAAKDTYNSADTRSDVGAYSMVFTDRIAALRAAVGAVPGFPGEDSPGIPAATLAAILTPDVVTIDFSMPVQFPNGRRLQDDVIDTELKLVLNRAIPAITDAIDGNDRQFTNQFPYLATPN